MIKVKFPTSRMGDCCLVSYFYYDNSVIQERILSMSCQEYERLLKDGFVFSNMGTKYCLDENGFLHNVYGPAIVYDEIMPGIGDCEYFIKGHQYSKKEWEKKCLRRVIFSAQKINTLKKLLYIPELYENVYYERKNEFISLIGKI